MSARSTEVRDTRDTHPQPGAEHASRGETSPSGLAASRFPVRAYSTPLRVVAVALQAIAALNILYIAYHVVYDIVEGARTAPPLAIALGLYVFSGLPLGVFALLRFWLTATIDVQEGSWVLSLRRARFEIPLASVAALRPWWLPLPGPGLAIAMTSGRRFRYRLECADPSLLLEAMRPLLPSAERALLHPSVAYARYRALLGRRRWPLWLIQYGLLPLALTVILFRLNQYIMYGGPFGQYHMFGLAAYLRSFGTYWAGTLGGLVVYAGVVRFAAEALALVLTFLLPGGARALRRGVEIFCQIAYYGLVPAYVLLRLFL